jgi:hypothetical protein
MPFGLPSKRDARARVQVSLGRGGMKGGEARAMASGEVAQLCASGAKGVALAGGLDAHARTRILAAQDHGVAVLCAGHQCFGPAARRGGDLGDGSSGETRRRVGLLHEKGLGWS